MEIDPQLVKQLREKTNAGFMDCKRALEEAGGDLEKAETILRTKGIASAGFIARAALHGLPKPVYRRFRGSFGARLTAAGAGTDRRRRQ
jgi:hypothetical protein